MPKCLLNTIRRQWPNPSASSDAAAPPCVGQTSNEGSRSESSDWNGVGTSRPVPRSRQRQGSKRKRSVNNLSLVTRFYMHTERTEEEAYSGRPEDDCFEVNESTCSSSSFDDWTSHPAYAGATELMHSTTRTRQIKNELPMRSQKEQPDCAEGPKESSAKGKSQGKIQPVITLSSGTTKFTQPTPAAGYLGKITQQFLASQLDSAPSHHPGSSPVLYAALSEPAKASTLTFHAAKTLDSGREQEVPYDLSMSSDSVGFNSSKVPVNLKYNENSTTDTKHWSGDYTQPMESCVPYIFTPGVLIGNSVLPIALVHPLWSQQAAPACLPTSKTATTAMVLTVQRTPSPPQLETANTAAGRLQFKSDAEDSVSSDVSSFSTYEAEHRSSMETSSRSCSLKLPSVLSKCLAENSRSVVNEISAEIRQRDTVQLLGKNISPVKKTNDCSPSKEQTSSVGMEDTSASTITLSSYSDIAGEVTSLHTAARSQSDEFEAEGNGEGTDAKWLKGSTQNQPLDGERKRVCTTETTVWSPSAAVDLSTCPSSSNITPRLQSEKLPIPISDCEISPLESTLASTPGRLQLAERNHPKDLTDKGTSDLHLPARISGTDENVFDVLEKARGKEFSLGTISEKSDQPPKSVKRVLEESIEKMDGVSSTVKENLDHCISSPRGSQCNSYQGSNGTGGLCSNISQQQEKTPEVPQHPDRGLPRIKSRSESSKDTEQSVCRKQSSKAGYGRQPNSFGERKSSGYSSQWISAVASCISAQDSLQSSLCFMPYYLTAAMTPQNLAAGALASDASLLVGGAATDVRSPLKNLTNKTTSTGGVPSAVAPAAPRSRRGTGRRKGKISSAESASGCGKEGVSSSAGCRRSSGQVSYCRDARQDAFIFYSSGAKGDSDGPMQGLSPFVKSTEGGTSSVHKCPDCGLEFASASDLHVHSWTHDKEKSGGGQGSCGNGQGESRMTEGGTEGDSGEMRNKCAVCSRVFTRSWLLKGHMRTHTGERPFRCTWPQCQRAFADKSNLRSHTLIHTTTAKSFSCPKCYRAFSQKRYLHKHMLEVCRII